MGRACTACTASQRAQQRLAGGPVPLLLFPPFLPTQPAPTPPPHPPCSLSPAGRDSVPVPGAARLQHHLPHMRPPVRSAPTRKAIQGVAECRRHGSVACQLVHNLASSVA